jgi:hypothetical protein
MPELDVTTPFTVSVRAVAPETVGIHPSGNVAILVPTPGGRGPAGPPGEGTQIFGETPTGAIDGANTVFTTANTFRATRTEVFLNGLRETYFTETGSNEITLDDPPLAGDDIRVNYIVEG